MEKVLAWSVAASAPAEEGEERQLPRLDQEALAQFLLGGKSDADVMKEAMQCITDPTATLENREIAFDNFEQLVENLDNANNMENLKLWEPLVQQLHAAEKEMRLMAAWCIGTAVQNNEKSQDQFHKTESVGKLVNLALNDPAQDVRSKAVYAISSYVRNHQNALDQCVSSLPDGLKEEYSQKKLDASDMDGIDELRTRLKAEGNKQE
ncbi:hypothetical protein H072_5419 [Dactylellina haptotyla CBS 200.50]|uniref:Nucleotide exchange factor Fes1 domain-containing protein n=1 Tax=Dactylellina haptotyla (strain CBS 200.50) TaxID=1284197 RepID=S8ACI1_DACHA|nr:hypothetical protein H072_5419 [Dactylellina haptotyla CBS 200.50]